MKKITLALLGAAVMAAGQASAAIIYFNQSPEDSTSGPAGNSHSYSADGVGVTATAWSLIGGSDPWVASYLGRYSGGLGVTNTQESDHTIDNYGSIDAVAFKFTQAVELDMLSISAINDSDISVWYMSGGSWTFLENDNAGYDSRIADVNDGELAYTEWMVSARNVVTSNDAYVDRIKVRGIKFSPGGPPAGRVPDAGGSLLLLGMGLGALRLMALKRKK